MFYFLYIFNLGPYIHNKTSLQREKEAQNGELVLESKSVESCFRFQIWEG